MSTSLTRGHVLIAEDNRDLSRIMSDLLKLAGYDVVTVHDGRDAVEAACTLLPEIVLLDIGLPGLDGFRVAERLRGEAGLQTLVIIAISGYDADMYPGRSRRAGFDHHLVKPVDLDALLPLLGTQPSDRVVQLSLERANTLREQTSFDLDVLPTSLEASMLVECIPRPELRAPVLGLIQRLATSHAGGQFALSLEDLFAAIGLTLEPSEWDKLRTRGDVSFVPRGDSHGAFTNQGPAQEVATGEGLTLVVPETLSGDYITTPSSFSLKFEKGSALRGCKRIFVLICQDIIKIDADEHKLYIDLPGEKYDLCFIY